jgi:hypothetical protein
MIAKVLNLVAKPELSPSLTTWKLLEEETLEIQEIRKLSLMASGQLLSVI